MVGYPPKNLLLSLVMTTLSPEPAGNATEAATVNLTQPLTKKANTQTEPGAPADKQVIVRVTEEMRDYWKAAAEATGVSLSEYIRELVQANAEDVLECSHPVEALRTYPWSKVCLKCGVRLEG